MPDITSLVEHLESRRDLRLVVLFGSQAVGEAGPSSDIDLGVLLVPEAKVRWSRLLGELSAAADGEVDLAAAPPLMRFKIA